MRDVLWTASGLDSVMDFEDDSASAIGEAHAAPSVLDIDSLEVTKYEDTDGTDETDEVDDVANKIQENFRTPKKQKKKLQRQKKKIERRGATTIASTATTSSPTTSSPTSSPPAASSLASETPRAESSEIPISQKVSIDTVEVDSQSFFL